MKRRVRASAAVCMLVVLLVGCGRSNIPDVVGATSILLDKNGGVTYYLTGEFDKEYYELSELETMVKGEAEAFCETAGETAVTVEKTELLPENEQRVVITYRFDSCESFQSFNGSLFFCGSVVRAVAAGYTMDKELQNEKGETFALENGGGEKLIITDEKAYIYCPAKVLGVSSGAVFREDGSIDTTATEDTVYILLKK